jgi:hypothetical protein
VERHPAAALIFAKSKIFASNASLPRYFRRIATAALRERVGVRLLSAQQPRQFRGVPQNHSSGRLLMLLADD